MLAIDLETLFARLLDLSDSAIKYGPFWVYAIIVAASFIENLFPPFPGDLVTVLGAALAYGGRLSYTGVFLSAYLGGIISVMIVYYLGRRFGHNYFVKRDFRFFPRAKIFQFEEWLQRWGAWIIMASRFILGFRTVVTLCAGIGRWPAAQMLFYSTISFFLFNGVLIAVTHALVGNIATIQRYIDGYETVFWIALGLFVVLFVVMKIRSRKKLHQG